MIRGFADKRTQTVFAGENPKGFPSSILKVARRKLKMVDAAVILSDLRVPPGPCRRPQGATFNTDQRSMASLFRMDAGRPD
jgi:plasmid maintenance system killer protein